MNPQCNTCKHFWPYPGKLSADGGQCRYHAPVANDAPIPRWPHVLETDGCGQHSPKPQEDKANV